MRELKPLDSLELLASSVCYRMHMDGHEAARDYLQSDRRATAAPLLEALRNFKELYDLEYLGKDPRASHAAKKAGLALAWAEREGL